MKEDENNIDAAESETTQAPSDQLEDNRGSGNEAGETGSDELKETEEEEQAIEAIKRFTDEDDLGEFSLKSILGGEILYSKFFRKQILWFIFVVILMLVYTGNRYSSQQDSIKIDSLRTELQHVKYNVLTQSSELMNLSRQSNIEERLRHTADSILQDPTSPPYLIRLDSTDLE